jgi:aryl-alcohol dehydrogenase-like predicted oxidoreductase
LTSTQTSLQGCATLDGTERYRGRFKGVAAEKHFRLGQNLWLSSIGAGTYLGDPDEEVDARYAEAIVRAVELGANVIDTAANYRFQRSERAIGEALEQLTGERGFARDEIVVCTKGGYLPFDGAPPADLKAYIEETFAGPGIVSFADIVGGMHCMTPTYLENQLEQSLRNMGLSCIDVYYVHNPESQLSAVSQEEFYARLRAAFELLERKAAEGKIRMYGVATWNGFRAEPDSCDYHSLERIVQTAAEVGGDSHHFRFIQLPFNLAMPEALFFRNQPYGDDYVSTLEAAEQMGITVIASASILQGKIAHGLPAAIREPLGSLATDAQTGIQFVRSAPGVTTALVGMSRRAHVEENLALARVKSASPDNFMRLFAEE